MEGLEKVAAQYAATGDNYNKALFEAPDAAARNNAGLACAMLSQQLARARSAKETGNILLSPISIAQSRLAKKKSAAAFDDLKLQPAAARAAVDTDYAALLAQWGQTGDLTMQVAPREAAEAQESFARTLQFAKEQEQELTVPRMPHQVTLPFPLHAPLSTDAADSSATATAAAASSTAALPAISSSLSFSGYLAPKFTSPLTKFPNYFYASSGAKSVSHMMVKSAKMWYVESEAFQMIDLPYLNGNFVATVVLPRIAADRTIQDHPAEFEYDQSPRRAATVDEVLQILATPSKSGKDLFAHYAKHMTLMPGLIGLPGFKADSTVEGQRSVLTLSPHGLDVGARIPRQRPGAVLPNFTALFDRPFLFFVRGATPEAPQILFAGVIQSVMERQDFTSRFPLPQEWREYKEQQGRNIKEMYEKKL